MATMQGPGLVNHIHSRAQSVQHVTCTYDTVLGLASFRSKVVLFKTPVSDCCQICPSAFESEVLGDTLTGQC